MAPGNVEFLKQYEKALFKVTYEVEKICSELTLNSVNFPILLWETKPNTNVTVINKKILDT